MGCNPSGDEFYSLGMAGCVLGLRHWETNSLPPGNQTWQPMIFPLKPPLMRIFHCHV